MESTYKIGETNVSNEGYVMKIVEYNGVRNIIIEFQDEYRAKVHTNYQAFKKGQVKNPILSKCLWNWLYRRREV